MKRLMIATAASALAAGSALAATDINAVDLDGNGYASVEEIKTVFPEFDVTFFADIDANGDNRVAPQEILELEAQEILGRYDMVPVEEQRLIVLDTDSSGFIDADEMAAVFSDFDAEDFAAIDTNDDNRVTYGEFYTLEAQQIVARYYDGTIMDIADIDTNGDAFADFNEMVAAYPGLSQSDFNDIDGNDDNRISSQELYAPEAQQIVSRSDS